MIKVINFFFRASDLLGYILYQPKSFKRPPSIFETIEKHNNLQIEFNDLWDYIYPKGSSFIWMSCQRNVSGKSFLIVNFLLALEPGSSGDWSDNTEPRLINGSSSTAA